MAKALQILADYRGAFEAGDVLTTTEILQFAKHDEGLSEQLLALEEELLVDAPVYEMDVERLASTVNRGGVVHRARYALEAWIGDHSADIRASIRLLPFAATVTFGISLYLLGTGAQSPLSWWLALLAALCIGSIGVVCTSSLWRPYPSIRKDYHATPKHKAILEAKERHGEVQRPVAEAVFLRQRRVTNVVWGAAMAASLAPVVVIVLQRPFLNDGFLMENGEYLISQGAFPAEQSLAVPLRFGVGSRSAGTPAQPVVIGARLKNVDGDVPIPLVLTVFDSNGELISRSRAEHGAALVSLSNYPMDDREEWLATIQYGNATPIDVGQPLEWSLYGSGDRTAFVAAQQPRSPDAEEAGRRLDVIRDRWEPGQAETGIPPESIEVPVTSESDSHEP